MAKRHPREAKSGFGFVSSVKLLVIIVLIALAAVVCQQIQLDPESLKIVGRVAGGFGLAVLAFGVIKRVGKIVAFAMLAIIAAMLLVSEGVIELPRVLA